MDDERTDFFKEMRDVKPLHQDGAQLSGKPVNPDDFIQQRLAAEHHGEDQNPLSASTVKEVAPHDVVSFKRPGIQNGVFRNLRLGKYDLDAKIDLHNHSVAEARVALYDFIQQCLKYDLRIVLILHGKGGRGEGKKAIIKSHALQWLESMPEVMAFHSTPANQGGAGALYVLLAKTNKAKQNNREHFGGK
ncbi:MAG: DNA endonuclease SmrA [Pseudomonadales bacterium]|nr:DNA endonuclease SmrA [Pseudomonadales bacterium]